MSTLNKGALYIVSFIFGVYYGILPLINIEVWVRNTGWIQMDDRQAVTNIFIGMCILIFIVIKNRYKKV